MPTRRIKILNLVIAIDTSGSISNDDLKGFFSEINSILNCVDEYKIFLIQCDAKIQSIDEYLSPKKIDIKELKIKGRGGTDFRPVFEYMRENNILYPLIYFTDLMGTFPDYFPSFPVLWVTKEGGEVPFGNIAKLRR